MRKLLWCLGIVALPFIIAGVLRLSMDKDHIANTKEFRKVGSQYKNRYPIVFHHGVVPLLTLHKFARDLRDKDYLAYSTQLSGANTYEFRGADLALQISKVLKETGASKVNIIAHSMGGVDARYMISQLGWGDRVASLSTISTPHRGTVVTERLLKYGGDWFPPVIKVFVGIALDGSTPFNIEPKTCFEELTPEHMRTVFNPKTPDDPRVYYQSWAGHSGGNTGVTTDWIHFWSADILNEREGDNDGIISVASAKWGAFQGTIPAPHSSQVGKPAWIGGDQYFDASAFYEKIAQGLAEKHF